jgi:hypothetical protein
MADHRRLYTEREISAILKRAGEMQADQGISETYGLSLHDLQQIAAEVGLDARLVAAAAVELDGLGKSKREFQPFGAPTTLHVERVVQGEVSEDQWMAMTQEMSRAFGVIGTSGQVGRTLEWTHSSRKVQLQVAVTPHEGQTKIRITGDFRRMALIFFLPWLFAGTTWGFALSAASGATMAGAASIALAIGMVVYMLSMLGFSAYARHKKNRANDLLRRLEDMIASRVAADSDSTAVPPALEAEQPRLSLDEPAEAEPVSARRRRTSAN